MFNKLDRNINRITRLPMEVATNQDYVNDLPVKLDEFLNALNKPAFMYDEGLIPAVERNCDCVKHIFSLLQDGKRENAKRILKDFLQPFIDEKFLVNELNNSYAFRGIAPYLDLRTTGCNDLYKKNLETDLTFFRLRTKKVKDISSISKIKDIVHLPYDLSSKATDMRYSREGTPCLYLAVTSWICTKECRWDENEQELYGAVFIPTEEGKKLIILNLAISQYLIDGIQHTERSTDSEIRLIIQRSMLRLYPLVLAMSYRIKDLNRTDKYEYFISQCLMDVLHEVGVDGIAYLSAQGDDEFQYPHGVNLALPALDIDRDHQFSKYCNMFQITKPVKYDRQSNCIDKSFVNKIYDDPDSFTCKIPVDKNYVFYGNTKLSKFDNYLCSQKRERI